MKKVLLIVLVLLVVVIAGLLVAPFLIPVDSLKQQLEARVERATGRALRIEGPVDVQILPTLAVEAEDVRLANVEGADEADMAALQALHAELKLWPLLSGTVEVDRFVLSKPVIHLQVDEQGRANWQFGAAQPAAAAAEDAAPEGEAGGDGGAALPIGELALGDIRLEDGTITYSDARSGTSERLENIDMSLELENLRSPLRAEGAFDYQGREVSLDLTVESLLALIQSGTSTAQATVTSELFELAFEGQLSNAAVPGAEGGVDLAVTSIRDLAAWLAQPLDLPGEGLQNLQVSGRLQGSPERVAFEQAEITLDQIEAKGEVVAELAGSVPKVTGRLDTGPIDLNPYLPPEPEPTGEGGAEPAAPTDPGSEGWSEEPIAIPPIGGVEVDFQLSTDGIRYREIELGPSTLGLTLKGDTLTANLEDAVLYDGRGAGHLSVTVSDGVPAIRQQFTLEGLQALPFLTDAAGFERLEGTADAEFTLETRGRSELELVSNLNGSGRTTFTDGAIVGINLAAMVRNLRTAFLDQSADEVRKTDFAELSGSFTIKDGVVSNDDLTLQAPLLRLGGSGRVDLPEQMIDYRIEPKAAPTLEGQGGEQEVAGILVPVVIEGPWRDPQIYPDLAALVGTAITDPEQLKQQLERLEEQEGRLGDAARQLKERLEEAPRGEVGQVLEGLSGVLGGQRQGQDGGGRSGEQQDGEQQGGEQAPQDPARQLLEGLFGN